MILWWLIGLVAIVGAVFIFVLRDKEKYGRCPNDSWWSEQPNDVPDTQETDRLTVPAVKSLPPRRPATTPQLIPRVIYQTHSRDDVPIAMRDAMTTIIDHNPTYTYRYFSSSDARSFIEKNFDARTLRCYDKLVPGAFKCDLFRYCLLLKYGGVYLDTGFVAKNSLDNVIDPTDKFISAEDNGTEGIYNAFMAAIPNHPIIAAVLELSCTNIDNDEYGSSALSITGPLALGEAFRKVVGKEVSHQNYPDGVRLLYYYRFPNCIVGVVMHDGQVLFETKYPNYRRDCKWYNESAPYPLLWEERRVYA